MTTTGHTEAWVKVNAPVDEGVAEIVALLSTIDGHWRMLPDLHQPINAELAHYPGSGNPRGRLKGVE